MKKSDLRSGMIVEYRNGLKRIVLLNSKQGDVLVGATGLNENTNNFFAYGKMDLSKYDEELRYKGNDIDFDIVSVYESSEINVSKIANKILDRKEEKEITMAEIEEKFGCKVKIVKEKSNED